MLPRDTLEALVKLGMNQAASVVKCDDEPEGLYYIRNQDGTLKLVESAPEPRSHTASDLTAIIAKAKEERGLFLAGIGDGDELDHGGPEVWFSRSNVTLFLSGNDRRETVKLPLVLSEPLARLIQFAQSKPALSQSDFVRELRVTFRDCLGQAGNLLPVLRQVKFKASVGTDTTLGHGNVSIGKSLDAQVTGSGDIPETVTLSVPVFSASAFKIVRANVLCALEPNAATATFQLIPFPGQIEDAIAHGEKVIGTILREELTKPGVGVYYGNP